VTINELTAIEVNPTGEANACVIWLHGLGASGHDFEPVVPALNLPAHLAVRFVFPHAPEQAVTINGGMVMRAWYDIIDQSLDRKIDLSGIEQSVKLTNQLILREIDNGFDPSRIILAGFSQGGVIALEAGLRFKSKLAGVIALSTYLADEKHVPVGNTPIFMGHGTYDPIVPMVLGKKACDLLSNNGHAVEWHDYPMDHSVCIEEIIEIGQWMTLRLSIN